MYWSLIEYIIYMSTDWFEGEKNQRTWLINSYTTHLNRIKSLDPIYQGTRTDLNQSYTILDASKQ